MELDNDGKGGGGLLRGGENANRANSFCWTAILCSRAAAEGKTVRADEDLHDFYVEYQGEVAV